MRQQYEPSADRIIALYQQLEDDILSAVIRRILKMGYVSEASKHQLEVLQAAGLLYDDIVQLIADRTDACTAQVKALFEDAGVQTVEIDNSLHEAAGALPIDIRQDSSTRQVLEAGYKRRWARCKIWSAQLQRRHRPHLFRPVTGYICRYPPGRFPIKKPL